MHLQYSVLPHQLQPLISQGIDGLLLKPFRMEDMLTRINADDPLGVDASAKGISTSAGSLYQFACQVKAAHPKKLAVVQVGEFYETWGVDAVCLVEWAGLNPMGRGPVPRAGFPLQNLHRTLRDLTTSGRGLPA